MPYKLPTETRGALTPLLLLALKSASVGVVVKGSDGKCLYASGLPDYFPALDVGQMADETLFDDDWLPSMREAQDQALQGNEPVTLELSRTTNSQYYTCECSVQRYEAETEETGVIITFVDLTNERKREDTLKALLREVSHRSKNLLAIIQSIAMQTALSSDDLETFVSSFRGRIAALSSAQDLVTDSNWRGAMFRELVARQFARYVDEDDERIEISGPDFLLLPNGATHIGLALHELIVNAIGYGALSNDGGHIRLSVASGENGMFEIFWDEDPGSSADHDEPVEPDGKRHFGSTVLQRVVPTALEGTAEYSIEPDRVQYRLHFTP